MKVVPGNAYGPLAAETDPLSVFPSYGLTRGLWNGAGCTDYLNATTPNGPFVLAASGSGAGTGGSVSAGTNAPGIESFTTGTTATGYAATLIAGNQLIGSRGVIHWRARFGIRTASDGTETFAVQAGLSQALTSLTPSRACLFRYQHSVNGGLLECVNRNASSEAGSVFSTSINPVMASGFLDLEIKLDVANGLVTYVSNGAVVTTIAVNVPSDGIGAGVSILKSAGLNARTFDIDAQGIWQGGLTR